MSERDLHNETPDPIETARQVHTLAQRLLQRVSSDSRGNPASQPETTAVSNNDDEPVTYWYP